MSPSGFLNRSTKWGKEYAFHIVRFLAKRWDAVNRDITGLILAIFFLPDNIDSQAVGSSCCVQAVVFSCCAWAAHLWDRAGDSEFYLHDFGRGATRTNQARSLCIVVFVVSCLFVCFVCTFLEKQKEKSIGETMALHSSAAPCYGASAIAGACGAQVLVLWFVCLSVRLSVRPFVVVLFVLLFLAGFWVLQSVGPCVWSGWRCAVSLGPPLCKDSST